MRTNRSSLNRPALMVLALMLGACASPRENAIFVTKTSLSVFDAETVPAGVSVAYDRVEGYAGPRFENGKVFPVVGVIETEGQGIFREIRQMYATGRAAELLTAGGTVNAGATEPQALARDGAAAPSTSPPVLFFATSTVLGLKLAFQASNYAPESLTLGYKRKEASVIPVDQTRHPSVFASLNTSAGVAGTLASAGGSPGATAKFQLSQFFATGVAADQLAANRTVSSDLQEKAKKAFTPSPAQ